MGSQAGDARPPQHRHTAPWRCCWGISACEKSYSSHQVLGLSAPGPPLAQLSIQSSSGGQARACWGQAPEEGPCCWSFSPLCCQAGPGEPRAPLCCCPAEGEHQLSWFPLEGPEQARQGTGGSSRRQRPGQLAAWTKPGLSGSETVPAVENNQVFP